MNVLAILSALSFSALASLPVDPTIHDEVDLVEVNHFYDDNAQHVFDQIIFYDWSDEQRRFQVRSWRLIKSSAQLPTRDWTAGGYRTTWSDGQFMRTVRAKAMRESWTQYDPEMQERSHLAKEFRRDLLAPRVSSTTVENR